MFSSSSNKFNSTGERVLDYIYHMTLTYFESRFFSCRNLDSAKYTQRYDRRNYVKLLHYVNHSLVVY